MRGYVIVFQQKFPRSNRTRAGQIDNMDRSNRPTLTRIADRFGVTASSLCAIHCALLPAVVALLPALGLGFLAEQGFERGFIACASVLALTTVSIGFRRHRSARAFWFLIPGIGLLFVGGFVGFDHTAAAAGNLGHAIAVSLGGTLVASAHWINLRVQGRDERKKETEAGRKFKSHAANAGAPVLRAR